MATDLLDQDDAEKIAHDICHDLESLFWVLFWICLREEAKKNPSGKFKEMLDELEAPQSVRIIHVKTWVLNTMTRHPFRFEGKFKEAARFLRQYALICASKDKRTFGEVDELFQKFKSGELNGVDPSPAPPPSQAVEKRDLKRKDVEPKDDIEDDAFESTPNIGGSTSSKASKRSRTDTASSSS